VSIVVGNNFVYEDIPLREAIKLSQSDPQMIVEFKSNKREALQYRIVEAKTSNSLLLLVKFVSIHDVDRLC
jgi:hypothetical protein